LDFEIEKHTINVNVIGFTEIISWTFKFFEKQGYGHLVGITSVAGFRGNKSAPSYFATKSYQIIYLESLRQKAVSLKKPIVITDIRPGFIDTKMAKGEGQFWVASKEKAANQIYGLIKRKKAIGYVTKRWVIIAILLKLLPNWIYKRM